MIAHVTNTTRRFLIMGLAAGLCLLSGCSRDQADTQAPGRFDEHLKTGALSLTIVGDYFHHSFIVELAQVASSLSPEARQIIVCNSQYEAALGPFLTANGVKNVEYVTRDDSSPVLTEWARDITVAARRGDENIVVVSPKKQARTGPDAEALFRFLQKILPDHAVRLAPFAFESGNLAFVESQGRRVLIAGRKIIFDNINYQQQPWAPGHDSSSLLAAVAETFEVDTVLVVGRARTRPPQRMYFEYHIDMGMAVLSGGRAVVSEFVFDDEGRAELSQAIARRHPVVTPFAVGDLDDKRLYDALSARLQTVSLEYDDYAAVLDSLGVEVYRSGVGWHHVLGSMSWTNVLQFGNRIVVPLYPDSLRGTTTSIQSGGGLMRISLDVSHVGEERFELRGLNEENHRLYRTLGYDVVAVPEYLHYMMGGLHCFVNILE